MKNKKFISIVSSVAFVIVGLTIYFNPDMIVKFISYFVGGLLIAVGLYKTVNYYIHDKNLGVVNSNEMAFGITAIILGLLFIFLAGAIELLLRFLIGGFLVVAGVRKLSKSFYTTDRSTSFYSMIIIGFIYIGIGLYIILVSNLALSIIGLFMVLYGIINIASMFIDRGKTSEETEVKQIAEAEIIDETEEEKEEEEKEEIKQIENKKEEDKETKGNDKKGNKKNKKTKKDE